MKKIPLYPLANTILIFLYYYFTRIILVYFFTNTILLLYSISRT